MRQVGDRSTIQLKTTKNMKETQMFERNLSYDGHTRRFSIESRGGAGWEVREEQDSAVVRAKVYDDWHRVERARSVFQVEILTLTQQGWTVEV
jgi:N-methylhydantoinase B/oxoprolinase/acetone carboxylase alpha subunit